MSDIQPTPDQKSAEDPSVLDWLRDQLSLYWHRLIKTGIQSQSSVASSETQPASDQIEAVEPSQQSSSAQDLPPADSPEVSIQPEPLSEQQPTAHVVLNVDVPIGTRLVVTIEALSGCQPSVTTDNEKPSSLRNGKPKITGLYFPEWLRPARLRISQCVERLGAVFTRRKIPLEMVLFGAAIIVYLFTRLWALDQFPIYFFGDEAAQTLYAEKLVQNGFRDANGLKIPIYVEAAGLRWTPLFSMYIQAASLLMFGKSLIVTRATSAIVSLLAALAVALILKQVFKVRNWWAGVLLVAITPAWFLHSRTAFETVMTTAFYGCFLLCYLLYRFKSPGYLYAAVVFGAITFYTYSNAQVIMAVTALFLFFSDIRYHLRHWKTILIGLLVVAVLALPLINFRLKRPAAVTEHLRMVNSYWMQAIPLTEKIKQYVQNYFSGLSIGYWFLPNPKDIIRHRWDNAGNIWLAILPLMLIGIGVCIRNIRSSSHRTILLAALATPTGAALLDIDILRVLPFIVPASVLAGLGLQWIIDRLSKRLKLGLLSWFVFLVLAGSSLWMLRTALLEGPYWTNVYGLYGMQYGAKQIFQDTLPGILQQDSRVQVNVSSTWANGADNFISFFLPPNLRSRVQMGGIESYLFEKLPLTDNMLFILTPSEFEKAGASQKFKAVEVDQVINYPDGNPGFFFVRLSYTDNIDQIFTAEKEARRQLVEGQVEIEKQTVRVRHSQIDAGQLRDLFDGDRFTLMRGLEANPFILEFYFPEPYSISSVATDFGSMDFSLTFKLYGLDAQDPVTYSQTFRGLPLDPHTVVSFDQPPPLVSQLRIEIKSLSEGERAHIHIRELKFNP